MANARKTSIHQQLMRRASRSEYKDGLLRNNQRHENRLVLELEQWEKAQRTVAKGLDKESQWFKQTSPSVPPQRKKNSLTDFGGDGQSRLIPDYQFRNRSTIVAQSGVIADLEQDQPPASEASENERERKPRDQTDSPKPHKKHSKKSDADGKKRSSKHDDDRKSSRSHRKSSKHGGAERESREGEGGKRDEDRPADNASLAADRRTSKATPQTSTTSAKPNHHHRPAAEKPTPPKVPNKPSKKHTPAEDEDSPSSTTTTTTAANPVPTTTTTATATTTATDAKSDSPAKTSSSASASAARAFSLSEDVHDPGDVVVFPRDRELRELGWDGRRRYTNVWDCLSAPKHASQVRSVRSRLQREFTQPPGDLASSKGTAAARRQSGPAPTLL